MTPRPIIRRAAFVSALAALPAVSIGAQGAAPARVCLAPASAQVPSGSAGDAANAVREMFASYLAGPTLAVAPLAARLPSQAREEARQADCPHVLFASLKHERKQGGGGLLGRVAGGAIESSAWELRGAARSAAARAAAGAASAAAAAAARGLAGNVKTKDELTLEYRLEAADGTIVAQSSAKAKASSDGQDVLTPLVERAAEAVASAALKAPR